LKTLTIRTLSPTCQNPKAPQSKFSKEKLKGSVLLAV